MGVLCVCMGTRAGGNETLFEENTARGVDCIAVAIFECCNVLWQASVSVLPLTRMLARFDAHVRRLKTAGGGKRAIFMLVSPSNVVHPTQIAPSFMLILTRKTADER